MYLLQDEMEASADSVDQPSDLPGASCDISLDKDSDKNKQTDTDIDTNDMGSFKCTRVRPNDDHSQKADERDIKKLKEVKSVIDSEKVETNDDNAVIVCKEAKDVEGAIDDVGEDSNVMMCTDDKTKVHVSKS